MNVTTLSKTPRRTPDPLERSLSKEEVSRILGTVTFEKAFYFYQGIAKPTGEFAVSLTDFCNKINTVSSECLVFHLKRGDFQKWIEEIIGDPELAKRINKIKVKNNAVRSTLHAFVTSRINELKESWPLLLVLQ